MPTDDNQKRVAAIRALYPRTSPGGFPLGDDAYLAIVHVAQAFGALVFRKDGGDHTAIPAGLLAKYPNGVNISRTIIGRGALGNSWFKVFGDGEGKAPAIWQLGETPADGEYVDVSAIVLPGAPAPVPHPTDPGAPGSLEARLAALEQWRGRVEAVRFS
jgi:hypothetical protein